MVTVFADRYFYDLTSFLPTGVNLISYDPEDGLPEHMEGIDALLVRTVTPVNEETLNRIPDSLQFIGTGSAGTDHIDTQLLRDRGIAFASAAGCNARSVAEYVATALLIWADRKAVKLSEYSTGVVGAGHTGSALIQLLKSLEVPVIVYDPPRARQETHFTSAGLEEVLSSDILTFHTPLTTAGPHPTCYWLDADKLSRHSFELIINTSRGGVVNEKALLGAHSEGTVKDMIIDVWEGEPVFRDELARNAFIKTPHIAGYSIQAKLKASKLIADKLIEHFDLSPPEPASSSSSGRLPLPAGPVKSISDLMTSIHPILDYQDELIKLIGMKPDPKARRFNKIRAEFPLRNEFSAIDIPSSLFKTYPLLKALFI